MNDNHNKVDYSKIYKQRKHTLEDIKRINHPLYVFLIQHKDRYGHLYE